MVKSQLIACFMVASLLLLNLPQGSARKHMGSDEIYGSWDENIENWWHKRRSMMVFTDDYPDPGANTNNKNGFILPSPPPPGE